MSRFNLILILLCTFLLAFSSLAYGKVVKESSGVFFGVRQYYGSLPEDVKYTSLGNVEARGWGGMTVEVITNALKATLAKAKELGANAVINIKPGDPTKGEAVYIENFPDTFTEEDFANFSGPKEYENSNTFKYEYMAVFDAVLEILKRELYDVAVADLENGIIETKPIEITNGKAAIFSPTRGSYPVMKLVITVKKTDENTTEVTEKYICIKGRLYSGNYFKTSNEVFFREIKDALKKKGKS